MISWALKEWAIAVDALLSGDLILLVRKGGIREVRQSFELPSNRFLLFPTYEHQKLEALRPPYGAQLMPQAVPKVGDPVAIGGWAQITHQLLLQGSSLVDDLSPFHIWADSWLTERLAWKPERPAYGLMLRVHRFSNPVAIPYDNRYGGCRSWVSMDFPESLPTSTPVLPIATYEALAERIQAAVPLSTRV